MTQLSVLLKMLTSMTVKLRLDILKRKPASPPFPFSFPTSYCTSGSIKWACCHESIILPATFSTQVSFGNPFLGWHTLSIKTLTDSRNAPRSRKTHEKKLQRIVDHKWLSLQVAAPKIFTKKKWWRLRATKAATKPFRMMTPQSPQTSFQTSSRWEPNQTLQCCHLCTFKPCYLCLGMDEVKFFIQSTAHGEDLQTWPEAMSSQSWTKGD